MKAFHATDAFLLELATRFNAGQLRIQDSSGALYLCPGIDGNELAPRSNPRQILRALADEVDPFVEGARFGAAQFLAELGPGTRRNLPAAEVPRWTNLADELIPSVPLLVCVETNVVPLRYFEQAHVHPAFGEFHLRYFASSGQTFPENQWKVVNEICNGYRGGDNDPTFRLVPYRELGLFAGISQE